MGWGSFEEVYRRSGLPEADRDAWVDVLLTYPRDTDPCDGVPSFEDKSEASAAVKRGEIPDDPDARGWYAWQVARARLGDEALLDGRDAYNVAGYVERGGTLAEARAYLDAVINARCPRDGWWAVWAKFEVSFSGNRFEMYRQMRVSPEDLAWFVDAGGFGGWNDVGRVHRWGLGVCPGAPWRVAAAYQVHGITDTEAAGWEAQRVEGVDVVWSLGVLSALAADER